VNAEKAYFRVRGWGWHRVCKIIFSILLFFIVNKAQPQIKNIEIRRIGKISL